LDANIGLLRCLQNQLLGLETRSRLGIIEILDVRESLCSGLFEGIVCQRLTLDQIQPTADAGTLLQHMIQSPVQLREAAVERGVALRLGDGPAGGIPKRLGSALDDGKQVAISGGLDAETVPGRGGPGVTVTSAPLNWIAAPLT
jgi:hypothetical protein